MASCQFESNYSPDIWLMRLQVKTASCQTSHFTPNPPPTHPLHISTWLSGVFRCRSDSHVWHMGSYGA